MLKGLWVIVVWTMLIAWIARVAQSRGRNIVGWALGGGAAGAAGFGLGALLFMRAVDADVSDLLTVLAMLTPLLLMVGAMIVVAVALHRSPVHVALARAWPVHVVDRGEGTLRVASGRLTIDWPNGSREVALGELQRAEPDGECLRVQIGGDELCLMPMGKPDSPAGRRQQSIQLAKMLRR